MKKKYRIYKFSPKGDELITETSVVKEAEKILKEAAENGCSFIVNMPVEEQAEQLVTEVEDALKYGTIHIMYPMQGGAW